MFTQWIKATGELEKLEDRTPTIEDLKEWILHDDRQSKAPKNAAPKNAYEQIWVTADRSTAIHYMADPTPKERFVVVYGRSTRDMAFQIYDEGVLDLLKSLYDGAIDDVRAAVINAIGYRDWRAKYIEVRRLPVGDRA